MAKFEKIGNSSFDIEFWKDKSKAEFAETFKDKRLHNFDIDEVWKLLQKEFKTQFPKK